MLLPPSQTLSVGLARAKLTISRHACRLLPFGHQERIANAGFWGFLERADALATNDHALVVSGWILPDAGKVTAIRVTLGGFSCGELRVEAARPDIGLLFPKRDEAQHCGFEGRLRVPDAVHGSVALVIWADLKSGSVVQGFARHIHVPLKPLITVPLLPTAEPAKRRVNADSSDERGMTDLLLANAVASMPPEAPSCSIVVPVFNNPFLTYRCLRALLTASIETRFEVIVVDNGSGFETRRLLECFRPRVRVLPLPENHGFVEACNAGAREASAANLVFLNNDTEVTDGWLDRLVATVQIPGVGAVGGMLVYPDGLVQEAGGIVFANGDAANWGNRRAASLPELQFAREVDYCSAACLLVRRDIFMAVGGFDLRYAPAYYEDVDLCFAVRRMGYRVMYQPLCRVVHVEGATAGNDVQVGIKRFQQINRDKFVARWRKELDHQRPADSNEVVADRRKGRRFLFIEHQLPHPDEDSGSARAFAIVGLLAREGCRVSFLLREGQIFDRYAAELGGAGVQVIPERRAFELLEESAFDIVVMARVDIAEAYASRVRAAAPDVVTVFDTVDLHHVRERRAAEILNDPTRLESAERTRVIECAITRQCDHTLVVTETDRDHLLRVVPDARVSVIPTIHEASDTKTELAGRTRIIFVGGFAHEPNVDAARFFVGDVLPLVHGIVPEARFDIIGSHPPPEIVTLVGDAIRVTGYVPDLAPYYGRARVAVAPLRFGAGMKGKICEAMAHGVPVVTTTIGAEGMDLTDGENVLIADSAPAMAQAVVSVYRDDERWHRLATRGRAFIQDRYSPQAVLPAIRRLMALARTKDPASRVSSRHSC